jgi:hypothetical protein
MKRNSIRFEIITSCILTAQLLVRVAFADLIGGVEFPQGAQSFADAVVSYIPGSIQPSLPHQNPAKASGIPDSNGATCPSQEACTYVSLGRGGSVTLRFPDNALTGSGNTDLDLWIFEVGSDVEDTFVEISRDGTNWFSLGKVFGSTSGIDIDAYGFGPTDRFSFVRLTDDPNEGDHSPGGTAGADIDAVGAISSAAVSPSILAQPHDVATVPGETVTFSVVAGGTPPLGYQWRLELTNIAGAVSASLIQTNANTNLAGGYSVVVTNPYGATTSLVATLEFAVDVALATATAVAWPAVATRAGFILEEADDPAGPWRPYAISPGAFQDMRLVLVDTGVSPRKFYRLRRP